ncbi:scavenger receptor cysteine-rich domain-containing group B protein-like [Mustelus asterias]
MAGILECSPSTYQVSNSAFRRIQVSQVAATLSMECACTSECLKVCLCVQVSAGVVVRLSDCRCACPLALRLRGGPDQCSGRVEIYQNSSWGTICNHNWDIVDASIVCRQLKCGVAVSVNTSFVPGVDAIWLDNVECVGTEATISECLTDQRNISNCTHIQDAGVTCSGPLPPRLRGGPDQCSGRVEIYQNSSWGTICNHNWDIVDASIVCRQLKCGVAVSVNTSFVPGVDAIWLDNVECVGTEATISECLTDQRNISNCTHIQDAGVTCSGPLPPRLRGGPDQCSGRVEIYQNSSWGTICNHNWDIVDASIVCRQLKCGVAVSVNTSFAPGVDPIWLDNVECVGTEATISECPTGQRNISNCTHIQDAGVTCSGSFPVRLTNGSDVCSGRVEILYQSTWGTVCDDGWDLTEGDIVCQQLNCGKAESISGTYHGQTDREVLLSGVRCDGMERSLDQCISNPLGVNRSSQCKHAGVTCSRHYSP